MNRLTPLEHIKGVGEKTASQLSAAGLHTVRDLIHFLPRRFDDYAMLTSIANIPQGKVMIKAKCEQASTRYVRRGMQITSATLSDDSGKLQAIWFNQPYRATQLKSNEWFYFTGVFEFSGGRYQLTMPSVERAKDIITDEHKILPVYKAVKGLKSQLVRKLLAEIRPFISALPETLPEDIITSAQLMSKADALIGIHFPTSVEQAEEAKRRLAFEEIFSLVLAARLNKHNNAKLRGWVIPFNKQVVTDFVTQLSFKLTDAQRLAAWEILQDFESSSPMNRLLQGDVGSGKTVIAGLAARQAAHEGYQTAIMAPTEILASQHAETLRSLLEPYGVNVGLLTSSVKGKNRDELYQQTANGSVNVLVGTHALLQDKLSFAKLGFVVIDEQHRFGVEQRQALLEKSKKLPHLLTMTATPIPRSLALTLYGELDISILNELPKGRKPIKTKIIAPTSAKRMYETVDKEIEKGRQAYVVCPLIDDNPDNSKKSVETEYKKIKNSVFSHRKIGLLHGKMKQAEKDAIMLKFKDGDYDLLVATTVIEVGVDVPNATVMIIESADHYGLSQLHQLRGRVGRSDHQSYCYLVTSDTKKPAKRLREIERSNDGFYLADVDLAERGAGEIYGRTQHGALNLQIARLSDTKLIKQAQASADFFIKSKQDLLQYNELAVAVQHYQRLTTLN